MMLCFPLHVTFYPVWSAVCQPNISGKSDKFVSIVFEQRTYFEVINGENTLCMQELFKYVSPCLLLFRLK